MRFLVVAFLMAVLLGIVGISYSASGFEGSNGAVHLTDVDGQGHENEAVRLRRFPYRHGGGHGGHHGGHGGHGGHHGRGHGHHYG